MNEESLESKSIYILPCCGESSIGRLTLDAAQELVLEGRGRWLSIDQLQLFQKQQADNSETPPTIIVDGCDHRCGARSVEQAGLKAEFCLVLSDLGIEENDIRENFQETLLLAKDGVIAEATRVTMKVPMIPGCCCR